MSDTKKPYLSIIIPTHNRASFLKKLLKNIFDISPNINFEIIVVDNNSKDETKQIATSFGNKIRYVFEENTSFTKARHTGANNALGEIITYLDDDVIIKPGTFEEICRIFDHNPKCAVAGGKILPNFQETPPKWILNLQKSFNGFSLYDLGNEEKKCHGIPGPLMAIRKSVFDEVNGFPPDTVGVETNKVHKTFKKLYIGPGDYGFCLRCKKAGYSIIYSPKIIVEHIIPPFRLTKDFWRSRMIGEGHYIAVTQANINNFRTNDSKNILKKLFRHFIQAKMQRLKGAKEPLIPDEIWFEHYKALREMKKVLKKNPQLARFLWNLGTEGVPDKDFETVIKKLPKAYQNLAL